MKTGFVSLAAAVVLGAGLQGGTVITENLPANTAIININAREDGAAAFTGNYTLWYHPFSTQGAAGLLKLTVAPGTYGFRLISPTDALALFPGLTALQLGEIYTSWTYNSPWVHDYLVFNGASESDFSIPQLFDGAPDRTSYGSANEAYEGSLADGSYRIIRPDPLGRAGTYTTDQYTFTVPTTLLFAVPDNGLGDNRGGVSVLISPVTEDLRVDWSTMDGGGGVSSDGKLVVTGTLGQHDAGVLSDGQYVVQGGFWPAILDVPPVPTLPPTNLDFVVVYSRFGAPDGAVWMASGDGSVEGRITTGEWPRVSPDGLWMAFRRGHSNYALASVLTRSLLDDQEAEVFRAGDYVVGVDWDRDSYGLRYDWGCGMYGRNRDNTGDTRLWAINCYDDAPVVNPVDGRLAFQNVTAGIVVEAQDGTGRVTVPGTVPNDVWPAWSHDGGRLVFLRGTGFWTVGVDGGGAGATDLLARLSGVSATGGYGSGLDSAAAFTPDDRWVVAPLNFRGETGLYAVAADGSGGWFKINTSPGPGAIHWVGGVVSKRRFTTRADLELSISPDWIQANEGDDVTVTMTVRNHGPSIASWVSVRQTLPAMLQMVGVDAVRGAVNLSGNELVFTLPELEVEDSVDVRIGVRVTQAGAAMWQNTVTSESPDPNRTNNAVAVTVVPNSPVREALAPYTVLYTRSGSPDGRVGLARGDGSGDVSLGIGELARYSPDGRYMLVRRGHENWAFASVYVEDLLDRTERFLFTPGDYVVGIDWAPDSSGLVYDWGCSIFGRSRDNTGDHFLVGGDCYDDAPAVDPVGGQVAFHNIHSGLWVTKLDGSGRRNVPNTTGADVFPAWSPGAGWLAFYAGGTLAKIRPDGTGRMDLLKSMPGAVPQGQGCAFSPDGRWVFAALLWNGATNLYAIAEDGSGRHVQVALAPGAPPVFVGSVTMIRESVPAVLTIAVLPDGTARLSWPASNVGWTLEFSDDLAVRGWQAVGMEATLSGGEWEILMPARKPQTYYRLRKGP